MSHTTISSSTQGIRACAYCQSQEVDADALDYSKNIRLAYRGHKVLQGAVNGCIFFQDCLSILEPILKREGF